MLLVLLLLSHARPVAQNRPRPRGTGQFRHTRPIAAAAGRAKSSSGLAALFPRAGGPALAIKSIEQCWRKSADHNLKSPARLGDISTSLSGARRISPSAVPNAALTLIRCPSQFTSSRFLLSCCVPCLQGRASRSHGTGPREGQTRAECGEIDELG